MGAKLSGRTRGRRSRAVMADINVTPMVDVMLVLLIIFMVTAPMLTAGVQVDLPKAEAKAISQNDNAPLEVGIDKRGDMYVGETKVDQSKMQSMLTAIAGSQQTSLAVVAPGIAEALFATAVGLVAAIPAVVAFNKFNTDLGRYQDRLDAFSAEFSAILGRHLEQQGRG